MTYIKALQYEAILGQVTEKNVKMLETVNPVDLNPPGIEVIFDMGKWIGDTVACQGTD